MAQFSHQAVATALLVAPACLLVRSFDRGSPALARRRDSRGAAAETPKVSVDTSTRPTPSAPAAAVSRTTTLLTHRSSLPAAVAGRLRKTPSAAADTGHDRHLTRPA